MQAGRNKRVPEDGFAKTTGTAALPSTLLEALAERSRPSWFTIVATVGLGLVLLLVCAAYLDDALAGPFDAGLWTISLMQPAMLVYLLAVQPILRRLRNSAIASFQPLTSLSDDGLLRLLTENPLFNRRREWVAVAIGIAGGLLLVRPWINIFPSFWLKLYGVLVVGLLYGVAGWFVYVTLAGTRLFDRLHDHAPDINVFEIESLEAVGHWSLGLALTYAIAATCSLFLTWPYTALSIEFGIGYGTAILVPMLIFFLNLMSTHRIMVTAKNRELEMVRDNLVAASQALHKRTVRGEAEDLGPLSEFVDTWLAYEKRVEAVPVWPYTTSIIRNLVLSLLLPGMAGLAQGALPHLLKAFMSPT